MVRKICATKNCNEQLKSHRQQFCERCLRIRSRESRKEYKTKLKSNFELVKQISVQPTPVESPIILKPVQMCCVCNIKPVKSFRSKYCVECLQYKRNKAACEYQRRERAEYKQPVAPVKVIPARRVICTDDEQLHIERTIANRSMATDLTDPRALHVSRPAAWLWRAA